MRVSRRLAIIFASVVWLWSSVTALEGRGRKGDHLYAQGQQAEQLKNWEEAMGLYEQAMAADPSDVAYQMAYRRVRFQAGQAHVDAARRLREQGKLEEALAEYTKAAAIDPASPVARQELQRTMEMIDRAQKENLPPEQRGLTPAAEARREVDERLASVMSVPELKPLSPLPQNLKINNQPPRVMFETVCKLAGINVVFDPDFNNSPQNKPQSLELTNATLEEALDYVSIMTRAFWKPISANAIFVTTDNPQKRNDFEEQVAKIFYIENAGSQADLTDIANGLRQPLPTLRLSPVPSQNALIVRGTADQVSLAEMLIRNLDRPKAEVVVDVLVMEVDRNKSRDLGASLVSGGANGLSVPIAFTPGGLTGDSATGAISASRLGKLSSHDFSVILPGGALDAFISDSNARILQSPQVRAIDNMKASLRIGERQPYSTGGFQPLLGQVGTGASSLYSSFQFLDVGVNADITPKVHGNDEVTLHIELDISNVKSRIDIGGISQPVVGQKKIIHDIRLREGEVNLLGGLVDEEETKSFSGLPVLSYIPVLGRLFSTENVTKTDNELLIALVPHIVRTPGLDELSYKGIASGSMNTYRLSYAPRQPVGAEPTAPKAPAAPPAVVPGPQAPPVEKPAASPAVVPQAPPVEKPAGPPAALPGSQAPPAEKPVAPATPPSRRAVLSPEKVEVPAGGTFTLNLQVENVSDLFAAPLHVKFDPNVLQLAEVTRGTLLAADGQEVLFSRNVVNETGDASMNLSRPPGSAGISGSGSLVTLTFRVVGKGVTVISAPQIAFQDSRGQTVLTASPQATVTVR